MVKRLLILLPVVGCIAFLGVPDVFGCTCAEKPTTLGAMQYSHVVVTGRIESVRKLRAEVGKDDFSAYRSATLLVEKVYKGNVKPGDRLLLPQGGSTDCLHQWNDKSVGGRWLFYLGEPSTKHWSYRLQDPDKLTDSEKGPMYGTDGCGRSTTLNFAASDLAYLDNIAKRKGMTRVSGELYFGGRPVEGIEVRINGKNARFKTKYLKGGFFEIYDVPPGEYLLEVVPPRGWAVVNQWGYAPEIEKGDEEAFKKLKKNQRLIRVGAGGHVNVDLTLQPDTMIKGRVLSPAKKADG